MAALPFRVQLSRRLLRPTTAACAAVNIFLTATTALFILLWAQVDELGSTARVLTRHVLIQGHLATENVLAAWYSSLLLAVVAALSCLAYLADRQRGVRGLSAGWLLLATVFLLLSLDELGSLHERIGMIGALSPWDRPAGWIYVLAIPIVVIASFMIAFALTHVRRVKATMVLMALGTVLFLLNPVLEAVEMRLIHGGGAAPGTWQRHLHDALLVLEEGGLELFGVLCFGIAVGLYVQRAAPDGVSLRTSPVQRGLIAAILCAGAYLSPALVEALPPGDSGRPQHWFPAVAWALVAVAAVPRSRAVAALALGASAVIGTGLYMYVEVMTSRAAWVVPLGATLVASAALEAVVWYYRFSLFPRSSTASPTLRRARPNPS